MAENLKLRTNFGMDFFDCIKKAKELAVEKEQNVEFEFNGINVVINKDTNLDHIWRDYQHSHKMDWKEIGPVCEQEYSAELKAKIAIRDAELLKEAQARDAERVESHKKKKAELEEKTKGFTFECTDEKYLAEMEEKNKDPYGARIISYAKEWGTLMQAEIAQGKKLEDIAEETSSIADYDGISGYMYGASVQVLATCWKHGEALRVWHNKKYGHEDKGGEKGVVNPAVLIVGEGEE